MRKRTAETSFEDLIANYYGRRELPAASVIEELLDGYYGRQRALPPPRRNERPEIKGTGDDGEVPRQRPPVSPADEYVVAASVADEYIVETVAGPPPPAPPACAGAAPPPAPPQAPPSRASAPASPAEEQTVDILRPFAEATTSATSAPAGPVRAHEAPPAGPFRDPAESQITEGDLAADLQAILSGQKLFDPATKQTVDRDQLRSGSTRSDRPAAPPPDNGQAIFDRIAQSMEYANAYDIGPVDLENRFADFDRMSELRQRARETRRDSSSAPAAPAPGANGAGPQDRPVVRQMEMIDDLDRIQRERYAAAPATPPTAPVPPPPPSSPPPPPAPSPAAAITAPAGACPPSPLALSLDDGGDYSLPFYDTGEHVLAGGDLFPQLRVGSPPGVIFSYGQLMSMGDFFESFDEMMRAPVQELGALKDLIQRSTRSHAGAVSDPALVVRAEDWNRVTNGRYLRLAATNYAHFSERAVLEEGVTGAGRFSNNRATWEACHRRAIEEAQRLFAARGDTAQSFFPEPALAINAFGDHFLTDAFASGHLINKEHMIAEFRRRFFNGPRLNDAARAFFARVAERAFVGEVARRFSELETVDHPVRVGPVTIPWRPNIDSAGRFTELLIAAAETEPEKVANFAVLALHDRLNEDGVEVTNRAGDATWRLTGDEHLNQTSLGIMRKAVQASVGNINDPAILQSSVNYPVYFEKVWRFVPRPTPAARQALVRQLQEYTDPSSTSLSQASAEIIQSNLTVFIDELIARRRLKPA